MNVITGVGICAILSAFAFKKKILSKRGVASSFLLGSIVAVLGGLTWLTILVSFVTISFISTKIGYRQKKKLGVLEGRHGERKMQNVLANGVIPVGIVLIYWLSHSIQPMINSLNNFFPFFTTAYIGSIATATSDTLASELGSLDMNTRLITNLKKVKPGTDGGISLIGEFASFLGALVIGIISFFVFKIQDIIIISTLAGIIGCHTDSFLGASLEKKNYLTNEHVNFLATLVGAIIGGTLTLI